MNVASFSEEICLFDVTMHCGKRELSIRVMEGTGGLWVGAGSTVAPPFVGPMF